MDFTWTSYLYFAAAAAVLAFSFWKPRFPRTLAARLGLRRERALGVFLLVYWIAVPVVIYRFLYLATTP
jgi:hypothetical protein